MQQSVVHLGEKNGSLRALKAYHVEECNTVSSLGEKTLVKRTSSFQHCFFGYRRDLLMYLSFFDSQLELLDA